MGGKALHRIYVAGPMTPTGPKNHAIEYLTNVRAGVRSATALMLAGFVVYCPMIDFQFFLGLRDGEEISEAVIRGCSMSFVEHWAEALLVLPGWENSRGTQAEMAMAVHTNIPVFFSIHDLLMYFEGVDRTRKGDA